VGVSISLNVDDSHSTNFVKPVDEMSEDRRKQLRRIGSKAIKQLLELIHQQDPSGVLRELLNDPQFVADVGIRDLIRGAVEADAAENLMSNVISTYHETKDKRLKRQLLSLYTTATDGSNAPTIIQARVAFNCSARQVWQSKLHAESNGSGTIVEKEKHQRNRLSKAQCDFLRGFSVNTSNIHMPAHSATADPKFLRKLSWKNLVAKMQRTMKEINVPPVGRKVLVQLMSGKHSKGYGRMRCFTGLCQNCTSWGYQNWRDLLRLCNELHHFTEENNITTVDIDFAKWISTVSTYYRLTFRERCTLDNKCASLCLRYALSDPNESSPYHSKCTHEHTEESAECNERRTHHHGRQLLLRLREVQRLRLREVQRLQLIPWPLM
jgi:uncharacterized protein YjgD (DUF1641 family)